MADATFSEIISEGLLQAGDTGLTARIVPVFNYWLRSQAKTFLWPQLKRFRSAVPLAAGVQRLPLGSGGGSITEEIHRINDPLKIYTSNYLAKQDVRIKTDWSGVADPSDVVDNILTNLGCPSTARVTTFPNDYDAVAVIKGKWDVIFNCAADRAYLLEVSYYVIPPKLASGSTGLVWYPNDRTCVQAVYVEALKYKKDDSYPNELNLLAKMVTQDRMSEGMKPGINDGGIGLDPSTYR
jgi:hypothetical protein